jgi:acyl carrier protein/GNAT superfamily N-acetyltransferase
VLSAPAAWRASELATRLRAEVAATLGFDDPDVIDDATTFYDLGMDSLTMADLAGRLQKRLNMRVSKLVFEYPSIGALTTHLLEAIAAAAPPSSTGSDPLTPTAIGGAAHVSSNGGPAGMLRYSPELEPDIFTFQSRAWPHRSVDMIPARWQWMCVESARRLGAAPRAWVYRDEGTIAAHMASIAVRVKIGSEYHDTGWLVDTMVLPEYRNRAVGSRLMLEAHEDQPFSLSLGQTAEMREIQFRLGWQQVAPLQIAQHRSFAARAHSSSWRSSKRVTLRTSTSRESATR